jgi:predicted dithiol-disulfide oxidoreductase (DUF899 family)
MDAVPCPKREVSLGSPSGRGCLHDHAALEVVEAAAPAVVVLVPVALAGEAVFVRRDGKLRHFWSSELWLVPSEPGQNPRHVDFMWPLWAVLDRTPEGRGTDDWAPELDYR